MPATKVLIGNVKGQKGDKGDTGSAGAAGTAATIEVGTVTSVDSTAPAKVENVGTASEAIFNFEIPKGPRGTVDDISNMPVTTVTPSSASFPQAEANDTVAVIAGKQAKAASDSQTGISDAQTAAANVQTALTNSHAQYMHTFPSNGWELQSSGDWSGYYRNQLTGKTIHNPSGKVRAAGANESAPATDDMKKLVSGMEFVVQDTTLAAYAKTAPTVDVSVYVEGVQ